MWNKLSFLFVWFVTSSIAMSSFHLLIYILMVFTYPFGMTFADIVISGESVSSIADLVEIFKENHINTVMGNLKPEHRESLLLEFRVLSSLASVILGIFYSFFFTIWLLF